MPTTQYGILDEEGKVIRWTWDKPSDGYEYVTREVEVVKKPVIDWDNFEPALF